MDDDKEFRVAGLRLNQIGVVVQIEMVFATERAADAAFDELQHRLTTPDGAIVIKGNYAVVSRH